MECEGRFDVFSGRLAALASAHNLLTASTWESAELGQLLRTTLAATAGLDIARCSSRGPPVILPPQTAVAAAMLIHELATNAIKYGALSNSEGKIDIRWSLSGEPGAEVLTLDWMEHGGPKVAEPERHGFGTRLIRRGLGGPGEVRLQWQADGLQCRIEARL